MAVEWSSDAVVRPRPEFFRSAWAYFDTDARMLWRMRTPLVFLFVVPALLSAVLGPAVSGSVEAGGARSTMGWAVLFSFMTTEYVGLSLYREFLDNTWLRQATHRPYRLAFIIGKIGPVALAGAFQLVVFGAFAIVAYHTPLHGSVVQLLIVAVPLVLCGCLLGVVLYNVTSMESVFHSLAFLLLVGGGAVGGTIVAPERLPAATRELTKFMPHVWALDAFTESTVGGGSWRPTLAAVAVIGAMDAVLAILALVTFDYTRPKSALV
jgi:ABC-2 type transport system permease protein